MSFMLFNWKEVTISSFPLKYIRIFTCMSLMELEESRRKTRFGAQKHKQLDATPKKKTISSLAFDLLHVQQAGTQSCNVDEVDIRTFGSKDMIKICFNSCSMFPTFIKYLAPYIIY